MYLHQEHQIQFFPLYCRCFAGLNGCPSGYSVAVWVKLASSMATRNSAHIIISGGHTSRVDPGGMSIYIQSCVLKVSFRVKIPVKRWMKQISEVEYGKWFHTAVTWNEDDVLTVFMNGTKLPSVSSNVAFAISPAVSGMHIGKPNNANYDFSEVSIDEWYVWDRHLNEEHVE